MAPAVCIAECRLQQLCHKQSCCALSGTGPMACKQCLSCPNSPNLRPWPPSRMYPFPSRVPCPCLLSHAVPPLLYQAPTQAPNYCPMADSDSCLSGLNQHSKCGKAPVWPHAYGALPSSRGKLPTPFVVEWTNWESPTARTVARSTFLNSWGLI